VSQSSMCSLLSSVDVNVQFNQFLISTVESDDTMSLVDLCKKGNLEGVKAALQSGTDVNTTNEYGWTGLMWAVSNGHNSVVDLLLSTPNIDVNTKDEYGYTGLMRAVERNDILVVQIQHEDLLQVTNGG